MRKAAFEIAVGGAIVALAAANPFVGEHKDKNVINHGNGRISNRLKPVQTKMNKYENLLYRGKLFKPKKTVLEQF